MKVYKLFLWLHGRSEKYTKGNQSLIEDCWEKIIYISERKSKIFKC